MALGNLADESALPVLIESLANEPEPLVRGSVAWALGRLGGEAARIALQQAAQSETDAEVLSEIWSALDFGGTAAPSPRD